MLRIRQIKLPINHNKQNLKLKIAKKLKIKENGFNFSGGERQ